ALRQSGNDRPLADLRLVADSPRRDGQDRLPVRRELVVVARLEDPAADRSVRGPPARQLNAHLLRRSNAVPSDGENASSIARPEVGQEWFSKSGRTGRRAGEELSRNRDAAVGGGDSARSSAFRLGLPVVREAPRLSRSAAARAEHSNGHAARHTRRRGEITAEWLAPCP